MNKFVLMNEAEVAEPSGSLLGGAPEATATVEQQVESQGPAVERPEWLLDKYVSEEREMGDSIAEQAKAYVELQKQFGGFTGAPEEYEFNLPEGVEGEVDTELDAYKQFVDFARDSNMSQETAQGLFNIFVGYQDMMQNQFATDFTAEKEKLGPTADARIGAVAQWAKANMDDEQMGVLETMTTTADQIAVLEHLIGRTRNSSLPKTHEVSAPVTGYSQHDFSRDVNSDRYRDDPAFRAEVRKKAAGLFPS